MNEELMPQPEFDPPDEFNPPQPEWDCEYFVHMDEFEDDLNPDNSPFLSLFHNNHE